MKALSLRQPWLFAVTHLGKRVENRCWNTSFRGEFLLHAAVGCGKSEYRDAVNWMVSRGLARSPLFTLGAMEEIALRVAGVDPETLPMIPPLEEMQRGGIVGRARLVDVLPPSVDGKPRRPWHMADQRGFLLEGVQALRELVPCRGLQRWFTVPDEIAARCVA